jgi:O-antigen ligase
VTSALAHAGGAVGSLGLALLVLANDRRWRLAGLVAWAGGCATLTLWLAPAGHHRAYAMAGVAGVAVAVVLAWAFVRVPWSLPIAILACAPARIPIAFGEKAAEKANLLVPLYVVVAGAALALAWQFLRGDRRRHELGRLAWPIALFVAWSGLTFLWSVDRHAGAIYLLFFVLPFGLLAVSVSRLEWRPEWVTILYVQLAAMAFVFALIGGWQYLTRTIYWNPKVKVDNAYAPVSWFYRVNSVFYDPSIYGRFLVIGILASLVVVLYRRAAFAWAAIACAAATWVGLVPSFSQSSYIALAAGIVVALALFWRRRAIIPLALAAAALAAVTLGVPQVRDRLTGEGGLSDATGGRSTLVSKGFDLALDHPVIGVGAGGFKRGYADLTGLKGKEPKAAASHDTPITVAAETGLPGLALLAWLLVVAFGLAFRGGATRIAFGLALLAIFVHSLFYNALFEDPLFWGLLALVAVAAREPAA